MTTVLRIWIAAAILCGLCAAHATGLCMPLLLAPTLGTNLQKDVPKIEGWVTDRAHLLSAGAETALESKLEAFKQRTGHDIAVLTVPNLGGRPIEDFALEVGRAWGMGSKERSDAALLVVSKGDRKMRIEVARGLEGVLPDVLCGRIIAEVITPEFRRGDFTAGIQKGIDAMAAAASGEVVKLPEKRLNDQRWIGLPITVFVIFILVVVIANAKRHPGTSSGRRMGGLGGWPWYWGGMGGGSGGWGGGGWSGGSGGGGGFSGFGGGGGFSGGGASGGW
jgi:uncharacterized protein